MRVSAGNKGSVFVHVKDAEDAGGGRGEELTTTTTTASTSLAVAKTKSADE